MKTCRKLLAIGLALLMLLSLSACGMSDLPLIKAGIAFAGLNSFHLEPDGTLAMTIRIPDYGVDTDLRCTVEGDIDYRSDPLAFSADLRVKALAMGEEETLELLAFGEDRDGDFVVAYSADGGGTWEEKTLGKTKEILSSMPDAANLGVSDILALGKQLGDVVGGFTKAGLEHVNGRSAARYDTVIRLGKFLETEAGRQSFLQGMAEAMDLDPAALAGMIDPAAIADMPFSLWLDDAGGRIVKAQLDLTDTMRSLLASGLLDSLLASETGLEGASYSMELTELRLAAVLSQFDAVGEISRPLGGTEPPAAVTAGETLEVPSTWVGEVSIRNHVGPGRIEEGDYELWGILDTVSDGSLYFELYDREDADDSEASPVMSFWAELDGSRIVPVVDAEEQDGWLINLWLTDADESELVFTLENGVLSASYFYFDAENREACDLVFTLERET